MWRVISLFVMLLVARGGAAGADLSRAPTDELLRVYGQLRQLRSGDQWAAPANVVWKRDAATFTFREGSITFADPVEGRVLGAVFEGRGSFELAPPTPIAQKQIARFAKAPRLQDEFRRAVFFFTDDSWAELAKLLTLRTGASPQTSLAEAQKKYAENFNGWWTNVRQGNFTMRNLPARMLADMSDPSSRGFFFADIQAERSGDLVYQISWNRDSLLLPEVSSDEEVMLLHYNPGNYYEWWAGFHLGEEYARTPRPEHRTLLAHCRQSRIQADVGKDNNLSATAEMEFEVPGGTPRILPLTLNGVLRIISGQDARGTMLPFIQEDRQLDSDPWVILPESAAKDSVYTMRIEYREDSTRDSRLIHQRGAGLYYVTERTAWYPSFGAFDDRTKFQLHFQSPKKFKFVATGRLNRSDKEKDVLTTEWESEIPSQVAGFNYGDFVEKRLSDARLAVVAYSGSELPDELKGVSSKFDITGAYGGAGGARNIADQQGIVVGGFNTASMAGQAAKISFRALKLFEHYFGQLPFKTVSVTEQPARGSGQSWPTLVFLPYDSILDATTRNSLWLQDSAEEREFYNVVAVHEMARQWWGHVVGSKTYHDQWLSDGIAEFSAALYLQMFEPNKWKSFWEVKRKWLFSKNKNGHRPVDVGPLWLNHQLNAYNEETNSMILSHYKGAYVLQMVRILMQDPSAKNPDDRFIAMMREFVATYAGKNVSTEDFRRMIEKYFGEPVDWFFNQWVYGTETPHYQFRYQLKDGGAGKTILQVSLTQSAVSDSFFMRVPLYVHIKGQPRLLGYISVRGANPVNAEMPLPFRPEKVTLDETESILCTIEQ